MPKNLSIECVTGDGATLEVLDYREDLNLNRISISNHGHNTIELDRFLATQLRDYLSEWLDQEDVQDASV